MLPKNTLYLINQGKIGVSQELSSLVKLNVNYKIFISNPTNLHKQNDVIFRNRLHQVIIILNDNITLIFSMIVIQKRVCLV